MQPHPIKTIICDDHDIMREGLVLLLEDEPLLKIVGLASNGQEAIDQVNALKPDIVLMDITMEGMNGLEATRHITESTPETNVIILTMHDDKAFFLEALHAGASGYFLKGADTEDLVRAIQTVHEGGTYLTPHLAGGLVQEYLNKSTSSTDQS
ncbi:MAG: response regulator transcription factor [Anaerolineales bacterium]|nr:response regulator transcription factor [Anaerolineales bacterium]